MIHNFKEFNIKKQKIDMFKQDVKQSLRIKEHQQEGILNSKRSRVQLIKQKDTFLRNYGKSLSYRSLSSMGSNSNLNDINDSSHKLLV